jgi:ABC-2 type transport system permease protein
VNGAVRLVARRELTERVRERSFLISSGITLAIVVVVLVLPTVLGFGGPSSYRVAAGDAQGRGIVEQAAKVADAFDAEVTLAPDPGDADATVTGGQIRADEPPDDELVSILQVADQQVRSEALPQLELVTREPEDPDRDAKAGVAFFAILILYGQLLTYGFWVATGVVEEKSSRVIEILLATIRPRDLLAGKVLGLGLLGLGQLLLVALFGLVVAGATGSIDVDADLVVAVALSLVWFVLGYAFYASAFAVAGALVPRQEEIQGATTPLTMIIIVSLFAGFAVNDNPDGTLGHVAAFIPPMAPVTMPSRIILGAAPAWEIAASVAVMVASTALLIPLAARIYSAVVLRTGSAVKLSEALRLARQ